MPTEKHSWILLVHQLPQRPTSLRVRTWRGLQALGAVPIKNSVYVLPLNDATSEDLLWLRQEIIASGGEASIFQADSVEGATDQEIISSFRKERDEDYARLISDFKGLTGAAREQAKENSLSVAKLTWYEAELAKLRAELDRVDNIDFFEARMGRKARIAYEECRRELQVTREQDRKKPASIGKSVLNPLDHQNCRWITRKDPRIDRLASAWLIKRFIDKRPRFLFVGEDDEIKDGLKFDMADGDFTHRGDDCTFETMVKAFGFGTDNALRQIAEIVHDIDLKDAKFNRSEAAGVNAVINGLAVSCPDDRERVKRAMPIFDALYESYVQHTPASGGREGR